MKKIDGRGWQGLPEFSRQMYKERYFLPDEDYNGWLARVAGAYADTDEHKEQIKTMIWNYWFHPATPVASNAGVPDRGLPVSCFVSEVGDSKEEIFDNYQEAAWLGAYGGGIGVNWSAVRSTGEAVGVHGGKSSGLIPFLKISDSMTAGISQGNLRRASQAIYLDVKHPEIMEFLDLRKATGDHNRRGHNLQHAVIITDEFMDALYKGKQWELKSPKTGDTLYTVDAFEVWKKILTSRLETGSPYIMFKGNANRQRPLEYQRAGYTINTSQLCVTGDTKILTKQGNKCIKELTGTTQTCWNGEEWSETQIEQTGDASEVWTVTLSDGETIEATDYHKWFLEKTGPTFEVRTTELKVGDELLHFTLPDGTYRKGSIVTGVTRTGKTAPVFCGYEPKANKLVFNGNVTGNCNEIMLNTSPTKTNICVLSSLNLEYWDEYKGNPEYFLAAHRFLDNVLEDFIRNAKGIPGFTKAVNAATLERALGMGVMGYHSYLQKNNLPVQALSTTYLTHNIFNHIKSMFDTTNEILAEEKGASPLGMHTGIKKRNVTVTSIAPTASISTLMGVTSPGIDPRVANVYNTKTNIGTHTIRNKFLEYALDAHELNTPETWKSIQEANGSVQYIEGLPQEVKDVFKTAYEIDQRAIVDNISVMQKYIDQGISANIFVYGDIDVTALSNLHLEAYEKGMKGLYYTRSQAPFRADVGGTERKTIELEADTCLSCS